MGIDGKSISKEITKPLHSEIGASSMYRWSACPGSVRLSRGINQVSSSYAEEGTLAHDIAAKVLMGKYQPTGNEDPEMIEAITKYIDLIQTECSSVMGCAKLLVEHGFDLAKVRPGLYGTADAVGFFPNEKLLRVYDYKHGAGIPVDVVNNSQLMYYALGALMTTNFNASQVEMVVVQPRCFHDDGPIRRWRIPAIDLLDFAADLNEYAAATENPTAKLSPGDHCRFCPAAGTCPAIGQKAQILAKAHFSPTEQYDPQKLSDTLAWLPAVEAWAKQVREFAYGESLRGRTPPGWKLVPKRLSRNWKNEQDVINMLNREYQPVITRDCYTTPELKSVAQIEKLVGKKEFNLKLAELVIAESSGSSLVPTSDARPAIINDAKENFALFT